MKKITIIGGGLAGLALGILLRRENVPVRLYEALPYPRHRVCGEFLSGRGRSILRDVLAEENLPRRRDARNAALFLKGSKPIRFELPEPALCVSRHDLDAALAREFRGLGGDLRAPERFLEDARGEGVVRASGRRRAEAGEGFLFGIKAHATGALLRADLELHFGARNYVGICRLANDRANVCGLFFKPAPAREIHARWPEIIAEPVASRALDDAAWDESSFCAVAGLTMDQVDADQEFSVGDAAGMIPPLTGNGMSMALESAALALPPLLRFGRGRTGWGEALADHRTNWRRRFDARLKWANFIQRMAFAPASQRALFFASRSAPILPRLIFAHTR